LFVLFLLSLLTCASNKTEEVVARPKLDIRISAEELEKFKTVILEGYEKYDAHLFSDKVNCFFRAFIENELHRYGQYWDTVFGGISIKHYWCEFNEFSFNVVRGSDGRFFYLGLSDLIKIESMIDSAYTYSEFESEYTYKSGEPDWLPLEMSNVSVLNEILSTDTLFTLKSGFHSICKNYRKGDFAQNLVFYNYRRRPHFMGYPSTSLFTVDTPWYNARQRLEDIRGGNLTDADRQLLEKQWDYIYKSSDGGIEIVSLSSYGLMAFEFLHTDSTIQLKQYFLPKLKRYGTGGCDVTNWDGYAHICGKRP